MPNECRYVLYWCSSYSTAIWTMHSVVTHATVCSRRVTLKATTNGNRSAAWFINTQRSIYVPLITITTANINDSFVLIIVSILASIFVRSDIETCFKYVKYFNGMNKFVFIGDSRLRYLFFRYIVILLCSLTILNHLIRFLSPTHRTKRQVYQSFIRKIDPTYTVDSASYDQLKRSTSTANMSQNSSLNTSALLGDELNLSYVNKLLNFESVKRTIWLNDVFLQAYQRD